MVNYASPFEKSALALRDIMALLQNINHPNTEIRKHIVQMLELVFEKPPTLDLLKLNKNKHISASPYLEEEELSHTRILVHWDDFTFGIDNVLTPLSIDIIVPKDLWEKDGKPRVFLIADHLYKIFQLQQVDSIGDLELIETKPTTLQGCAGLNFLFYTTQYE